MGGVALMNSNRWTEMKYSLLTLILLFAVSALLYGLSLVFHAMGKPWGSLAWLALLGTGCFVAARRWWYKHLQEQAVRDYKELRELIQKYEHLDEAYKSICDANERLREENGRLRLPPAPARSSR
jgi:hypothetical protein